MSNTRKPDLVTLDRRIKIALLVVSLATICALAMAAVRENRLADWYRVRSRYARLLDEKATDERGAATARYFTKHVMQNYLPELGTVDRCITCHAGVEDPRMAEEPQPLRTHPGRYLQIHDPEKFGCTVCHQGQGRATTVADAHGDVAHWDWPLLETRFVKSTCTTCHLETQLGGPDGLIAHADADYASPYGERLVVDGRRLVGERGCLGCHSLAGKGGSLGPDLSYVGEKTRHQLDFTHVPADPARPHDRRVTRWLELHFLDPAAVTPGSVMPAVGSVADAESLTAYMLSLRSKEAGRAFFGDIARDDRDLSGAELYGRYCSACHGIDGSHSGVASIKTPSLSNPDTLAVASDDYLRLIIANGRSGSRMPAWREGHGNLGRAEIDRIVDHIRSWQPTAPPLDEISSTTGNARAGAAYYRGMCAGCHGLDGEGGLGNSLRSPTFLAVADDRFLARSIVEGRPGTAMPSWRHVSAQAVSDILAFIRTWQPQPPSFERVQTAAAAAPIEERVRVGRILYDADCRSCHGADGRGGLGPSLTSQEFLRAVDDGYLYRAITRGRPTTAMPAWRHLPPEDIGAIMAYLRSFQSGPPYEPDQALPTGDWQVGKVYYDVSCAGCHGPAAIGGVGPQLGNRVFQDTVTDAQLFRWIAAGRTNTAMKGFLWQAQGPTQLTRGQIVDVIAYLRWIASGLPTPVLRTGVGNPKLGAQLFAGTCASCHGPNGEGASGPQLNNPAFLATASDGFLAATIIVGRSGTPMASMVHGREGLGQIGADNVADVIAFLRLWDAPNTWRRPRNIVETNEGTIAAGRESYGHYCAGCHGENGLGGSDPSGGFAPALNNREFLEAASDGFLVATIARGRGGTPMRPFGKGAGGIVSLDDREINDIVSFIRSWQQPIGATSASSARSEGPGGKDHEQKI